MAEHGNDGCGTVFLVGVVALLTAAVASLILVAYETRQDIKRLEDRVQQLEERK